jgi:cytochrome c553
MSLVGCSAEANHPTQRKDEPTVMPSTAAPQAPPSVDAGASPSVDAGKPMDTALDAALPVMRPTSKPATYPRPALCDRAGRSDSVIDVFCAEAPAHVGNLADLQLALGFVEPDVLGTIFGGAVVVAHSTALSGDVVSELNPRTIITKGQLFVAFSRGVQQVEIIAPDRIDRERSNFYLVTFRQACNDAPGGCVPGDLYTPRIESDWLSFKLEDDEDLKNTTSDCRQCHQRGLDKPMLLMRELVGPWTHFFGPDQEDPQGFPEMTGTGLLREYLLAKGDEHYSNLSVEVMRSTVGFTLQNLVPQQQPVLFDGSEIMNQRWPWTEADGYPEVPAKSAIWYAQYEAFKRGEQLPLPYYDPRVSDKAKQQKLTAAYQAYRKGELSAEELPDFADIFPDDPMIRAEIGLQTEPGATPAQMLIQACASCHNEVLDQSISRARFSVALGRMSRDEISVAVARLQEPRESSLVMPPRGRRQIDAKDTEKLIEYLQAQSRPAEDDALLDSAAKLGMAGVKK